MTTLDEIQNTGQKWSIKECKETDGWKLKDVRRKQVKVESLDGTKIMREVYSTNFDKNFNDRYWRVGNIHLIENDKLKAQFEEYRNNLAELGRPKDTILETIVFSAESEKSCKDICQDGCKVSSKKRHVLGHTGSGVHLVRHFDILTRYLMFQQYNSPAYVIVYKTFLGKKKPIVPRLHKDDNFVSPYAGFDSHVSARHVEKGMPICEALNCSYVYLYDFDQTTSNNVKYPRQILPYAILQLEKKLPCVPENPFLAVGTDGMRSTWEVKGETRRGFRFMFTKSGLKGKHKDFTKSFSKKNMGSYLKGQILEMRTKSANIKSEAKPPLVQKTNKSCSVDKGNEDSGTPPDKQKLSHTCKQSDDKNEKNIFGTEFQNLVIPKSVRAMLQNSNFKPFVKLKRLDSSYMKGAKEMNSKHIRRKINPSKVTSLNGQSRELDACVDSETSEKENATVSDVKSVKIRDCRTVTSEVSTSVNNSAIKGKTLTATKECDSAKLSKKENIGSEKCTIRSENGKRTSEGSDGKANTNGKSDCDVKTKPLEDKIPLESTQSETGSSLDTNYVNISEHVAKKTNETKTENEKHSETKSKSASENSNEKSGKKALLSASKMTNNETNSVSNNDQIITKQSGKEKLDKLNSDTELDLPINFRKSTFKADKHENRPEKLKSRSTRGKSTYSSLKSLSPKRSDCATSKHDCVLQEKQTNNSEQAEDRNSRQIIRNSRQLCSVEKNKNEKSYSKRFYPVKTKFGRVVCMVTKNTAGTKRNYGGYKTQSNRVHVENVKINGESKEYCLLAVKKQSRRIKGLPNKIITESNDRHQNNTIDEKTERNNNRKTPNKKDSCRWKLTEENTQIKANDSMTSSCINEDITVDKHSNRTSKTAIAGTEQSRNHSERVSLEKSKSPVCANAAPDILNASPNLVSAKISTSPYSKFAAFQDYPPNTKIYKEAEGHHEMLGKVCDMESSSNFLSEMLSYNSKGNSEEPSDKFKNFTKQVSETYTVCPVLRATFSKEVPFKTIDKSVALTDTKETCSESTLSKRKQKCNMSMQQSTSSHCPQLVDSIQTSKETKFPLKQNIDCKHKKATKHGDDILRSKPSPDDKVTEQDNGSKSSEVVLPVCVSSPPCSIQHPDEPTSNNSKNENALLLQPCNETKKLLSMETEAKHIQQCKLGTKSYKNDIHINTNNVDDSHSICSVASTTNEPNFPNQKTSSSVLNENSSMTSDGKTHTNKMGNVVLCEEEKSKLSNKAEGEAQHVQQSLNPRKRCFPSDFKENASVVKVDTNTADRLRSFLSNTAAVTKFREKSVEQKNDTCSGTDHILDTSTNHSVNNVLSFDKGVSSKENSGLEAMESSKDSKILPPANDVSGPHRSFLKSLETNMKTTEPLPGGIIKERRISQIKRNRRRDSTEMHDNDSQDTVIGGVTNVSHSPVRHQRTESLDGNANLQYFETVFPKLIPLGTQENISPDIKEEKEDDSYREKPVSCDVEKDADCCTETESSNYLLSSSSQDISVNTNNFENQSDEVGVSDGIKLEQIDDEYENSMCVKTGDNTTQEIKTEPGYRSNFFPRTRRELERATDMLNASDCRNAIVETLKELSSVLKFLTESSTSRRKQSKSGEIGAPKALTSRLESDGKKLQNSYDSYLNVHVKTEGDYMFTVQNQGNSFQRDQIQNSEVNSDEHPCYLNDSCTTDQEPRYEYIIKPDQNDENEPKTSSNSDLAVTTLKNEMRNGFHKLAEHESTLQNLNTIAQVSLSQENEIDALPQLFDPSGEPDITCLEGFGISLSMESGLNKTTSTCTKGNEKHACSDLNEEHDNSASTFSAKKPLNDMKIERSEGDLEKVKQKQSFSFKTGVLNKGLKQRKNMFDLKINSARQKHQARIVNKKTDVNFDNSKEGRTPSESKENQHEHLKKEVYKAVSEKLSMLKENPVACASTSEQQGMLTNSESIDGTCSSLDIKNKEKDSANKDSKFTSEKLDKTHDKKSRVKDNKNDKKHLIIPFEKVIHFRERQYHRFRRGESTKRFLDYNEILPEYFGQDLSTSTGKLSDGSKDKYDPQEKPENVSKKQEEASDHQDKTMNTISNSESTEFSGKGTTPIEQSSRNKNNEQHTSLKRHSSEKDDGIDVTRTEQTSDNSFENKTRSDRSRSKSSHRSSEKGHKRSKNSSSRYTLSKHGRDEAISSDSTNKGGHSPREFKERAARHDFSGNFMSRPYPSGHYRTANRGILGKTSFHKGGTGYFSWRRKYQPRRNIYDGFVVTAKGSIQTVEEYERWTRFKERESLRSKIENAINAYKRTFENTPGDTKGNEKVASYLNYLTDRLAKIQSKRGNMNTTINQDVHDYRYTRSYSEENEPILTVHPRIERAEELFEKFEKSHNFSQHRVPQRPFSCRFDETITEASNNIPHNQHRQESIEELLKEHLDKHCEYLSNQIKQELSKELKACKKSANTSETRSSKKGQSDRSSSRDSSRDKYRRKNIDEKYRRRSRERDNRKRESHGDIKREYDRYGSRRSDFNRVSKGDPYHKSDKDRYTSYTSRYDRRPEVRGPVREIYDRRIDNYHYPCNSDYEHYYKRDDYRSCVDVTTSEESKANRRNGWDMGYASMYDYHQYHDMHYGSPQDYYQNAGMYMHEYTPDKTQEIDNSYRPYPYHDRIEGGSSEYYSKSVLESKHKAYDKTDKNDEDLDLEEVQDEFDANTYRTDTPLSVSGKRKRTHNWWISKSQRFSRFTNKPTYFYYDDDRKDNNITRNSPKVETKKTEKT